MGSGTFPDPPARGLSEEPVSDFAPPHARERMSDRVARSDLWPLLLGGRPHPLRHPEALFNLAIAPLQEGEPGLQVWGELDVLSVLQLERALADGDLPIPFVLDLSGVTFMDGVGFSLLARLAQMADGKLAVILRNPSRAVTRVLTIVAPQGIPGLEVQRTSP
jgi:anti-anti-sigma factor